MSAVPSSQPLDPKGVTRRPASRNSRLETRTGQAEQFLTEVPL